MKKCGLLMASLVLTTVVWAQAPKESVLIRNGTVLTITNGTLNNTDVLIIDGIIRGIGKDLDAPSSIMEIDATGQYVMPGIIDAHSHIGIDAVNEGTNPITPEVNVGDALNPTSVSIYRALAGGVTTSHAMHGSANAIGGECETIKHRWGTYDPEIIRMEGAPRTIKFALGENPMRVHGEGKKIKPRTRMGVEQVFRDAFSDAQDYMRDWEDYRNDQVGKAPPRYSGRLEALADILRGEIIIHCHSYRADEILMLMDVLKDFGVDKIVFQHVNEGFKVAPELAEFGAMASVFADWWAYKFEVYYSTAYNAAILTRNGVITSINSDSGELIRHLFHEAGKAQKYGGLSDDEALALITINPAIQLGVGDRIGSIEEGKEGDVAIFNHHPLSIYAVPQKTIIDGKLYFDVESDIDDIRVDVDPEEEIPAFEFFDRHDHDRCMQDVFETLFIKR
ncbi:MAG: amidohydrolase family protein [Saprospiraceae bacterium]|nr:amidohydrolase family protein [Saprospiraceae bacterium]